MLDFGALPPEINSARMYAGPGSGPTMAAASAWDALAAQLDLSVTGYSSVLSVLQGESWSGAASVAMATAAAPYVAWLTTTAAQAEQAANQARAAAAGYEAAFAATVPPAVVAANRILLATLVATNLLGQNTPAIAATEAAYAEMWAQDAAAMYGYAVSESAAATLTPFSPPPQTTNPAGQSAQGAAVAQAAATSTTGEAQTTLPQLMSAVPQQLQALSTTGSSGSSTPSSWLSSLWGTSTSSSSSMLTAAKNFNSLATALDFFAAMNRTTTGWGVLGSGLLRSGVQATDLPALAKPAEAIGIGATTPGTEGVRGEVLASVNDADRVGGLSVPQNWTAAAPDASPAAEPVASSGTGFRALPTWAANPPTNTAGGVPALGPMTETGRRTGNAVFRMRDRRFRMPRPAVGG